MNTSKVVIVTGGNGLLGKTLLLELKAKNFIPVNLDIADHGQDDSDYIQCDVTNPESAKRAFDQVLSRYGHIDGLVNTAYPRTKDWGTAFEQEPYESILKNVEMQMTSVMYLNQLSGNYLPSGGSIVNITSIYGVVGNDPTLYEDTEINTAAAYSAIKGGLISFTRYLAARWGKRNIRVNCVSPGGIFDHQDPGFVERYEKRVPLKRMGTPQDITPAIVFLLSDEAKYITGHNLVVDGGWTII